MDYKDYYKILGVDKKATEKDIKQAYRKLARKFHPDVNPGDNQAESRFKEINEAHEVLSDPEKRKKYDQFGSEWQQWQRAGNRPQDFDWGQWAGASPGGNVRYATPEEMEEILGGLGGFSDFFQSLFGGTRTEPGFGTRNRTGFRGRAGQDLEQTVEITLEEAYHGTMRRLQKEGRILEVKIPPGVKTGSKVKMTGEGLPGMGGAPAGDLYLNIEVQPHPNFDRREDDLTIDLPVDLYTALLGDEVKVPTLKGTSVLLKVPPETQNGQTFRLKGQGMPTLRDPKQHGDLFVRIQVQLPKNLSERERDQFRQLAQMRKAQ
ncbi:MAG: hypothetical protein A2Z04_05895 [Chloroflexi bacterium RBG_16_57_9]|nr:MAG: hypothetical protein A2Z04_05895 [Chloroflexi bacterium RBG_16_57_9]